MHMKMENLYIRLDGTFADKVVFAKRVSETILSEPLDEVIRYMCDSSPDDLNKEIEIDYCFDMNQDYIKDSGYTAQEVNNANIIEHFLNQDIRSDNICAEIHAISKDKNSLVYLGKTNKLKNVNLASKKKYLLQKEKIGGENYFIIDLKFNLLCM